MVLRDFRRGELLVAGIVALQVPLVALGASALGIAADLPDVRLIDPGPATAIRVRPVLDLDSPLARAGGDGKRLRMPKAWAEPSPFSSEREADEATRTRNAPNDPSTPAVPTGDNAAPSSLSEVSRTPSSQGTSNGGGSLSGADGIGGPGIGPSGGDPNGDPTADPRKRNAARRYLSRIVSWFTSRFHAACDRLGPEDRLRYRAVATVTLDSEGTVTHFSLMRSGNREVDDAAERALEAVRGQQIPPPPEDFPELRPASTNVTFVCAP